MGLVLGASGVKAARVSRKSGVIRWGGSMWAELPVDRAAHPTETAAAVVAAADTLSDSRSRLVAGIGSRSAGLHFLQLPFDQVEKTRRVIRFEAEPLFLTPVEDLAVDFLPLPKDDADDRPGMVFGGRRVDVLTLLEDLESTGLSPGQVLPERLGLVRAGMHLFEGRSDPNFRLLLDLGASQTGMALFHQGFPLVVRSFFYGGNDITNRLAEAKGIALFEAEELKQRADVGSQDADPDDALLAEAWEPVIMEIERTLAGAGVEFMGETPEVVLGGGGAHTPGLARLMAERLELPVTLVTDYTDEDSELAGFSAEALTPFGLALQAVQPGRQPNLRQGELAPVDIFSKYKAPLSVMAVGILAVLGLMFGNFWFGYYMQTKDLRDNRAQLERILRETVPGITRIQSARLQMNQELEKARKAAGGAEAAKGRVLDLLLDVSRLIGELPTLRVTDLSITPQSLEITGEGGDFETIDTLKNRLAALPRVSEASIGRARMDPNTKVLSFKITLKRSQN